MLVLMIFSRIFFKIFFIWLVFYLLNIVKVKIVVFVFFNWVIFEVLVFFYFIIFLGILVNFIIGRDNCVNRYVCVDYYFSGRVIFYYFSLM